MKSKPYYRIVFVILVALGSLLFVEGARKVSAENNMFQAQLENDCSKKISHQTNTEFIFFESVTKFLVISLVR